MILIKNIYKLVKSELFKESVKCNICGYEGRFGVYGTIPRISALCPQCHSLERHRLLHDYLARNIVKEPIIHFAPEPCISKYCKEKYVNYKTADLYKESDCTLDLENLQLKNRVIGTIIANHVIQCVDDTKALPEIHRVLKVGGILVCSVPLSQFVFTIGEKMVQEGKESIDRYLSHDNARIYGLDFSEIVCRYGFKLQNRYVGDEGLMYKFGIPSNEVIFIFEKC